jgi:hypothetical protein
LARRCGLRVVILPCEASGDGRGVMSGICVSSDEGL